MFNCDYEKYDATKDTGTVPFTPSCALSMDALAARSFVVLWVARFFSVLRSLWSIQKEGITKEAQKDGGDEGPHVSAPCDASSNRWAEKQDCHSDMLFYTVGLYFTKKNLSGVAISRLSSHPF